MISSMRNHDPERAQANVSSLHCPSVSLPWTNHLTHSALREKSGSCLNVHFTISGEVIHDTWSVWFLQTGMSMSILFCVLVDTEYWYGFLFRLTCNTCAMNWNAVLYKCCSSVGKGTDITLRTPQQKVPTASFIFFFSQKAISIQE